MKKKKHKNFNYPRQYVYVPPDHVYDLVDEMRMVKHDHRVLRKAWDWAMNQETEDERT